MLGFIYLCYDLFFIYFSIPIVLVAGFSAVFLRFFVYQFSHTLSLTSAGTSTDSLTVFRFLILITFMFRIISLTFPVD